MDLTGRSLKHYQLLKKLGEGGMGVVYHARDTVLDRDVAVKVLSSGCLADESVRHRFRREAKAASALNHPNVITVYEIGSEDGIDLIAMEYVSGRTLQSIVRHRRLSFADASGYASQVAAALVKAHAAGVVHRDIKPGNLMVTDDGLVKVLDFGLARLSPGARSMANDDAPTNTVFATLAGTVMGTVAYMSPEQASGQEAGPQSDIFSLGVVLYQMLSGELPFVGDSVLASLHRLHFEQPKDLRTLRPEIPEELARIVDRMLEKGLSARYASMAEVLKDLRSFAGLTGSTQNRSEAPTVTLLAAPPLPTQSRLMQPWFQRKRVAFLAAVLLLAVAAVLVGRSALSNFAIGRAAESFHIETARPYDLYVRARGLLDRFDREDNIKGAVNLLERAVEKDNNFALGYATLTEAYRFRYKLAPDTQWLNLMAQSAERALKLNPDLAAAHLATGIVAMEQTGKAKEAESHFRRALDLDPRSATPHIWIAILFSASQDYARATDSLQRALRIDPNNWAAHHELGVIHYKKASFNEAVAALEQSRQLSPDNLRVLPNLAAAYIRAGRHDDAASTLQRAIEIEPAARHYANLGTLRFFQGRYADAVPPLEKAVELLPNRYLNWGNLADAYRWSPGHKARAHSAYLRAIQLVREQLALKPGDPDLRSILALYLAKSGDKDAALAELAKFDPRKPAAAGILFRLTVAYEVSGLRDQALATLPKAIKAGYAEKEIRSEPELLNLRHDVRYHKLMAVLPQ